VCPETPSDDEAPAARQHLRAALVDYFLSQKIDVRGALGVKGYPTPQPVRNDGFGSGRPHMPQVVGYDSFERRVVFGILRESPSSLANEEALEEYNVFLDHNAGMGKQASQLVVMLPEELIAEFTAVITHYIHREYWHRILTAASPPVETR
jgi:hypothetical protein